MEHDSLVNDKIDRLRHDHDLCGNYLAVCQMTTTNMVMRLGNVQNMLTGSTVDDKV